MKNNKIIEKCTYLEKKALSSYEQITENTNLEDLKVDLSRLSIYILTVQSNIVKYFDNLNLKEQQILTKSLSSLEYIKFKILLLIDDMCMYDNTEVM